MADGKVKLAKCLIDNGSEVNLVSKGSLQDDEARVSSTPVQLEGVSGHCLDGGNREADSAVRLVKQCVWSVETVTEEWFSGKCYEATIRYDLFLGQPWLHAHRVSPWDTGDASSKIRQPATGPNCIICVHTPRVFSTSKSQISYKFSKTGRNGQGIESNSSKEKWNH